MKKSLLPSFSLSLLAFSLSLSTSLFAAPGKGPVYEPVAEGYCSWAGLVPANRVMGRDLCASDLRHKFTVVIFADPADFEKNILSYSGADMFNPSIITEYGAAETMEIPRDKITLLVFNGKTDKEKIEKAIKSSMKEHRKELGAANFYIYANVTGSKVPDNGGKLPFYCVFGPEPGDPIASGEWDAAAKKKIRTLAGDKKYQPEKTWRPYYGFVEEPQFMKNFSKVLASGKPLDGLTASCRKGINSKNPEQAKECQILYDALEQTRSEYLFHIAKLAAGCPTRAFYEAQILLKQWPKSKKSLQPAIDRIKSLPDMPQLCKMFQQLKTWGSEDFKCKNAGEAKKIEAELKKMKVTCDGIIQKSNVNVVQGAAAWIGSEAETLAPLMATKVPVK